jgi:hypothetical protein
MPNIFRKTIDTAKEKFEDAEDSTVRFIKKNPIKSVLIALGIGAVIGAAVSQGVNYAVKARARRQSFWNRYNPFN